MATSGMFFTELLDQQLARSAKAPIFIAPGLIVIVGEEKVKKGHREQKGGGAKCQEKMVRVLRQERREKAVALRAERVREPVDEAA